MYCPKCSQPQIADETKFCSRCGFLLTGVARLVENDGLIPGVAEDDKKPSLTPRKKGLKQGLFMLLMAILIAPILMIFAKEMNIRPALFILTMFILVTIGLVRMIYAKIFEADERAGEASEQNAAPNILSGRRNARALPAAHSNPVSDFVPPAQGGWRDSNELIFSSVTDVTTKQLDKN